MNHDNKQLQAVAISAKIVELEEKNKEVFQQWYQLKAELKALENQIEPSKEINHEIH